MEEDGEEYILEGGIFGETDYESCRLPSRRGLKTRNREVVFESPIFVKIKVACCVGHGVDPVAIWGGVWRPLESVAQER